jgi:protease-4
LPAIEDDNEEEHRVDSRKVFTRRIVALSSLSAVLLGSVCVLGTTAHAQDSEASSPTPAPEPAGKILRVTLAGPILETNPPIALFGGSTGTKLTDLVEALDRASRDPQTAALVLRLKAPQLGWTQAHALRRAILSFRSSGKPVHCHIAFASTTEYLLASACGEVALLPSGFVEVPGVSMGHLYLGRLLDKLGIEFQELRGGRYKGAAEMLTRSGPSEAVEEETHAILDDLYEELVDAIAENRGRERAEVRAWIDRASFLPMDALRSGLVDRVEYEDEFLGRVTSRGETKLAVKDAEIGTRLKLEVSGFAGIMTIFNELFAGPKRTRGSNRPKIAVIHGVGAIVTSGGAESLFGGSMMSSDSMVKILRQVRDDETVRAVVFRIDSPGGSALASDLIWREVKLTAALKPVVVSMGDFAASGGYYVACAAHWIVAERGTLTGSIGVIGVVPDLTRLFGDIGIDYSILHRGKRAGGISPTGRLSSESREVLLGQIAKIYDDFISRVAEGRKMKKEAVDAIAEGRVWTGVRALEVGLVDELGGLDAAITKARALSQAPEDAEILDLPLPKTFFEILNDTDAGLGIEWSLLTRRLPREVLELCRGLEWIRDTRVEKAFLVHPRVLVPQR